MLGFRNMPPGGQAFEETSMNRFIASVIAAALWLIAQGANALDLPGPLVDADWLATKLE